MGELFWQRDWSVKARNPKFKPNKPNVIARVQAIMNTKEVEDFKALKAAIPELTGKPYNEVQQAVQDAGYEIEFN